MYSEYERIEIQISLDNLKNNLDEIRKCLNKETKIIAVVKNDAYRHGAKYISTFIEPFDYIYGFGVSTVEEGISLRKDGITKPILILGSVFPNEIKKTVLNDLSCNIYEIEIAKELSKEAISQKKKVKIHISIDTGMGRFGFRNNEKDLNSIKEISKLENVEIEGIFTHLSKSSEPSNEYTLKQIDCYNDVLKKLENLGIKPKMKHISSSIAIIKGIGTNLDVVRAGTIMYGISPDKNIDLSKINLKPVLSLTSRIVFIKDIDKGESIGYGGTFISDKKMTIAIVSVGFGDGYPQSLSNIGYVLIHDKKAKILGIICMDQIIVDISDIEDVKIGDIVTVIGKDKNEEITMEEIADLSKRIYIECLNNLSNRIPRVYYEKGVKVGVVDYFSK